jgi:hypothetical protein
MRRGLAAAAIVALSVLVVLAGAFLAGRASAAARSPAARWALYVEKLKPDGKLVVLTSEHRYAASKEFAAKLLAVVNLRASITVSAWADVAYCLDVTDPKRWSISWDARRRAVTVAAPEPDCMPPAVRTDTIEVSAKGANLVTNMAFRLKDEAVKMRGELSADLMAAARASLADPAVRDGIRRGLADVARSFCVAAYGVQPETVAALLPGD